MYIGSQKLLKFYDQALLDDGYTIEELVDKASDCLFKHMKKYERIAVLCGPGNNGADGLSMALKLFNQGKQVHIFIFDDNKHLSIANQFYLDMCYDNQLQITLLNYDNIEYFVSIIEDCDAIVDAMFGFGLNSSPRGIYKTAIEEINKLYEKDIIAVDIPTGLDCNTGKPYQSVVCATHTITLTALKNGFLNPDSVSFTGKVILERLDVDCFNDNSLLYQMVDGYDVSQLIKERLFDGHKMLYGKLGMIVGCDEYKGAALLSTKSAVYSGSGLVTLISDESVLSSLTNYCPEATSKIRPLQFIDDDLNTYSAMLLGSGLGLSIDSYRYVENIFEISSQPLVVDGDGLTILAGNLNLLKFRNFPTILTPHLGEFKRLCPFDENDDLLYVAKEFAKNYNVILVLKGPYTIVTDGHFAYRVIAGNKAMSTAGMGDVLAGMITSFLGQGYSPLESSLIGVYTHGYIGDQIAQNAYSVIASQMIEYIPKAIHQIKNINKK